MSQVAHFAINADDLPRARRFYEQVFGWKFQAWGPPGFYMIDSGPQKTSVPALRGSLQGRRELVPGVRMTGFECTIGVADIEATHRAILANGGKIVMEICTLATIGRLLFFQDPEGNLAGAMQYDEKAE
jgi:predicted enzyme related to lactoylglutathione lyase